jgi:hypothetical protein
MAIDGRRVARLVLACLACAPLLPVLRVDAAPLVADSPCPTVSVPEIPMTPILLVAVAVGALLAARWSLGRRALLRAVAVLAICVGVTMTVRSVSASTATSHSALTAACTTGGVGAGGAAQTPSPGTAGGSAGIVGLPDTGGSAAVNTSAAALGGTDPGGDLPRTIGLALVFGGALLLTLPRWAAPTHDKR